MWCCVIVVFEVFIDVVIVEVEVRGVVVVVENVVVVVVDVVGLVMERLVGRAKEEDGGGRGKGVYACEERDEVP